MRDRCDESTKADGKIGAIAVIANSKAAEKLANAVEGLVQIPHRALDLLAGAERIRAIGAAHAEVSIADARAKAEAERIRAETAAFVFDRETRKTLNRQSILAEAQKALPAPGAAVSDEPVAKDFVHAFFDEFDGISDPEVHKIVGRLLAGEVVRPGSFPRRTMRVLRDLESSDFAVFAALCRFTWTIGAQTVLVFELDGPIYSNLGLTFDRFIELEVLGLVTIENLTGYARTGLPQKFKIRYGALRVNVELKAGESTLNIGKIMFTDAGRRLCTLTNASMVPGFAQYAMEIWKAEGHTVLPDVTADLAA